MSISLCMIAKDEEKNIAHAIDSVKDVADEIVVVDTGSADRTKEVARQKGAKVVGFRWDGDFSAARNESLKHATKDWILVLDCDEVIAREDLPKIRELAKREDADGFAFTQLNYANNKAITGWRTAPASPYTKGYDGFYASSITRLFRNGKGFHFKGRVHELAEPSIAEKKGKIEPANVAIHHYGNADPEKARKKLLGYLDIAKKKAGERQDAQSYYELGVIQKDLGQDEEARQSFEAAIGKDKHHALSQYELGIFWKKKGDISKAIGHFSASAEGRQSGAALLGLGGCYLQQGDLKKAYAQFIKAAMVDANNPSIYNNLGIVHERRGNIFDAIKMYELAARLSPRNPLYPANLGNALVKNRSWEAALKAYEVALELGHPRQDELKKSISGLKEQIAHSTDISFSVQFGEGKKEEK